jgi:DNA primase
MASSDVEKIKQKLSLVEVVSSYVKLTKAGRTWKGKSPFSNERTASFFIDPEKNLFHCFSSGKGGDIFSFVQEIENVDFQTALKMLADKAGIELTKIDPKQRTETSTLYEIMEYATKLYEIAFRKDKEAVDYLLNRGMTKDTMKEFRIGYAPAGWTYLYDQLRGKFPDALIEKAGLGVPGKKGLYDRFRERIMFPIADSQGRITAFSGRIFVKEGSATDPKATGKYVNSPETPIYHKSEILYGYDRAKRAMMTEDVCVLVEGQMDLVMSHQAGVINTVALSGTALTREQIVQIQRFTDTLIIALDTDTAGIKAAGRSAQAALVEGMYVSVIALSPGQDPADVIKENPELWKEKLSHAQEYIDFRMSLVEKEKDGLKDKTKLIRQEIFPFIAMMKGSIEQDNALQRVAHFLSAHSDAVRADFTKWLSENQIALPSISEQKNQISASKNTTAEELLLILLVWQESKKEALIDTEYYKVKLKELIGEALFQETLAKITPNQNSLIFQAELRYDAVTKDALQAESEQLLRIVALRYLEKKQAEIMQKIEILERKGDEEEATKALSDYQNLTQQIEALNQNN